jgi:hypothetical protein
MQMIPPPSLPALSLDPVSPLPADAPDATLHELAERLGHIASYVTVHRTLEQWNLPLPKRHSEPPSKTDPT